MAKLVSRALGVPGAVVLVAGCAGNLQIPPPGPDNPANPSAGSRDQPQFETVLSTGPAAPVPGAIDARMDHDSGGQPASSSAADEPGPKRQGHEGMRHDR